MAITVRHVVEAMETIAPPFLACANDPIGLHVGNPSWRVRRLLLCVDITPSTLKEAKQRHCQMIVAHHPLFYHPLRNLVETSARGWLVAEISRQRLAVYCAHTNLDNAAGGINDTLADMAGLQTRKPLTVESRERLLKLAIFVPESHLHAVRAAVCAAGAGQIGAYRDCSFRVRGIGTFCSSASARPYLGKAGKFEEVEEWRLEVLLREGQRKAVEEALRRAHPYEEPAYDFFPLAAEHQHGLGRVGELAQPTALRCLAQRMKRACASLCVAVRGDPRQRVQRLAVLGGGPFAAENVLCHRPHAFVVGEISPLDADFLHANGCAVIVLGHAASEAVVFPRLQQALQRALPGLEVRQQSAKGERLWTT